MEYVLPAPKVSTSTPKECAARLSKIVRSSIPKWESAKNVTTVLKSSTDNARKWTLLESIEDAKHSMEVSVSNALKCSTLAQIEFARKSIPTADFGLKTAPVHSAIKDFFHKEEIVS